MKLLLDHNLSPKLVDRLADLYPDMSHVALVGLERATNYAVWDYARVGGYIIVTKDSDFTDVSIMRGFPPKVLWLRMGNCTTGTVELALRRGYAQIAAFATDTAASVLELI